MATKKKSTTKKKKATKKGSSAPRRPAPSSPSVREKYAPLIHQYLKKFQNDPTSRIFAPLAEAYRKAGLIQEAIDVARDGLRVHPQFSGGKVALARALFEGNQYAEVLEVIDPIIHEIPDNLVAQKLLAESHLMLGQLGESLNAFKMLLFFSPHDREIAEIVRELETQRVMRRGLIIPEESEEEVDDSPASDPMSVEGYTLRPAGEKLDPVVSVPDGAQPSTQTSREQWANEVETLQGLLLKVERYRGLADDGPPLKISKD